ncbi:MAG: hypothetical protein EZS28_046496, partial [Streblomastix strix]
FLPPITIIEYLALYRISGERTKTPNYASTRGTGGQDRLRTTLQSSGASGEIREKSISGAS